MTFPSEKELERIREKLDKSDPSYLLPENAAKAEKLKYELCKKFVAYIRKNKVSQIERIYSFSRGIFKCKAMLVGLLV